MLTTVAGCITLILPLQAGSCSDAVVQGQVGACLGIYLAPYGF